MSAAGIGATTLANTANSRGKICNVQKHHTNINCGCLMTTDRFPRSHNKLVRDRKPTCTVAEGCLNINYFCELRSNLDGIHVQDKARKGRMDAHSDFNESTATSPPTSLAPQSDDEFTSALVRHAAKRLGFDVDDSLYLPPHASPQHHKTDRQFVALSNNRRLPEILRQLEIRQKALGPKHESLVDLHMQAGKHFEQAGELGKSEHHFTSALDVLESSAGRASEALLPILTSLGHFYASRGRFFDAQAMFSRAASVCEACHTGRLSAAADGTGAPPQRLKSALLQWKGHRNNEAIAAELRAGAAAAVQYPTSMKRSVADADAQTVEEQPPSNHPMLAPSDWQRLSDPTMSTADDMRRLLHTVKQEQQSQVHHYSLSRESPPRSSASTAAARSANDVRRLLEELRKAKS